MKLFGRKSDVAVIGYGSWATALIGLLTKKGKSVCWHVRNLEILETLVHLVNPHGISHSPMTMHLSTVIQMETSFLMR